MKRSTERHGFTIVEVLVTLAILAALAAVFIPTVRSRLNSAEAAAIVDNLKSIRQASLAYRDNVGRYPRFLTQLQDKPSIVVGDIDLCSNFLPTTAINAWRGPYLAQRVTDQGLQVGGAKIPNELKRNPATPPSGQPQGYMLVEVQSVEQVVAQEVDQAFDPLNFGTIDLNAGGITWQAGTLTFHVAVRNC